jgi:hypothetical protein
MFELRWEIQTSRPSNPTPSLGEPTGTLTTARLVGSILETLLEL